MEYFVRNTYGGTDRWKRLEVVEPAERVNRSKPGVEEGGRANVRPSGNPGYGITMQPEPLRGGIHRIACHSNQFVIESVNALSVWMVAAFYRDWDGTKR